MLSFCLIFVVFYFISSWYVLLTFLFSEMYNKTGASSRESECHLRERQIAVLRGTFLLNTSDTHNGDINENNIDCSDSNHSFDEHNDGGVENDNVDGDDVDDI